MCTPSTKRSVEQIFFKKIEKRSFAISAFLWRTFSQDKFTSRCNSYVTFLVANNTLSNNLKYPHSRNSQNSFGSVNIKSFYGNGFLFNFQLFPSKSHQEMIFLVITREISKSDFDVIICKRQWKFTLWGRKRGYYITSNQDIIYLPVTPSKISLSAIFFSTCRELLSCLRLVPFSLKHDCTSSDINLSRNEKLSIFRNSR